MPDDQGRDRTPGEPGHREPANGERADGALEAAIGTGIESDPVAVSRRAVLGGLVGAGVLGTTGGLGTAALLGDGESFGALFAAGAVDLWVDGTSSTTSSYDLALDPANPEGTARIELSLPPLSGAVNNDSFVRVRSDCPVITGEAPFAVPDAVSLAIDYVDCATAVVGDGVVGGTLRSLFEGSATDLLDGVLLDGFGRGVPTADRVAFEPGTPVCLRMTWTLDPAALDDAERAIALTLHFDAVQARHSPGFDATSGGPCTFAVPESRVSFVAFCSDSSVVRDGDVSFAPERVGSGDEYDAVRWATTDSGQATQLSTVVLFSAGAFANVAVGPGTQSGLAALGSGTPGTTEQRPNSPGLPGEHWVKYEWQDGAFVFADASDGGAATGAALVDEDATDDGVTDVDTAR